LIPKNFNFKKNLLPIIAVVFTSFGAILVLSSINDGPGPPRKQSVMPKGFASHMLEDRESSSAKIFMRVCTQCHGLADPKSHSAQEWPATVARMFERMQRTKSYYPKSLLTLPTNEEVNTIIAYLALHGRKKS